MMADSSRGGRAIWVCVLANGSLRAGRTIAWNGAAFKVTDNPAARRLLHREYRPGWSIAQSSQLRFAALATHTSRAHRKPMFVAALSGVFALRASTR